MSLIRFPDPRYAGVAGIVTMGGRLSTVNLLRAYQQGIFPWPIEGWPLTWFCPEERAILEFKDLHIPRSLARARRRTPFRFTIDLDFRRVILACAHVERAGEDGTWITPEMIRAYCDLHQAGHAHSVEAWEGDQLVGGLYGVDAGGAFAGESMFFFRPNASKMALLHLIEHFRARGLDWIDIQVMTPHMRALGARLISRDAFLEKLALARARGLSLFDPLPHQSEEGSSRRLS
ncbi:MAG TPA: leucyl/phenylalanyl-tRNA--protein transferase [Pyrinomonadaceae bacterium]|nr:leucyl/phenylalanyl-tRNA--protein transferase [Pyrinomonadaceae bacterium]